MEALFGFPWQVAQRQDFDFFVFVHDAVECHEWAGDDIAVFEQWAGRRVIIVQKALKSRRNHG